MLAAPKKFDVTQSILESDYILPSLQTLYAHLQDLKISPDRTKVCFEALLTIFDDKKIKKRSLELDYGKNDFELKHHITYLLGEIDNVLFTNIYNTMYVLLHQYYLDKSPDKPEDVRNNTQAAHEYANGGISREQLYERTVTVFESLSLRLFKFGEITKPELKELVLQALHKAKEQVLNPPAAAPEAAKPCNPALLPFRNIIYMRQRQEAQTKARLALEAQERAQQEEADRALALALAGDHEFVFDDVPEFGEVQHTHNDDDVDEALNEAVNQRVDDDEDNQDDYDEDQEEDNVEDVDEDQQEDHEEDISDDAQAHQGAARLRPW